MRARLIVVDRISRQHAAQVSFSKNNDVVQTLAAKRADQALGYPVLPGRSWADRPVTDPHRRKPARENVSIGAVIVAHEVGWR